MNRTAPVLSVPVRGGGAFAVHRIYCVGRNYRAHVVEMGGDPDRELPFYFTKPVDALVPSGSDVAYPPMTNDFQHEGELVIAIGADGRDVAVASAYDHVFGFAAGIDLTRRDLQLEARKAGRPWDMGKAFDASAPCGTITRLAESGRMERGKLALTVNDEVRQQTDLSLLIWSVAEIVADLSRYVMLRQGDLVFTGTPEGVSALEPGDLVRVCVDGLDELSIRITKA